MFRVVQNVLHSNVLLEKLQFSVYERIVDAAHFKSPSFAEKDCYERCFFSSITSHNNEKFPRLVICLASLQGFPCFIASHKYGDYMLKNSSILRCLLEQQHILDNTMPSIRSDCLKTFVSERVRTVVLQLEHYRCTILSC